MKLHKIITTSITTSIAIGIMSIVAGCMGNAAATYWDGKKYDILSRGDAAVRYPEIVQAMRVAAGVLQ